MQLKRAGVVPGHDMTSEAALAKLSYLLGQGLLNDEITQQMVRSLRGELTEQTAMAFQHPSGLPAYVAELAALGYAISKGQVGEVAEVLKGSLRWVLNEADYSGNTPLVSYRSLQSMTAFTAKTNSTRLFIVAGTLSLFIPPATKA